MPAPGTELDADRAVQAPLDRRLHDVHAHAPARHVGDDGRRAEARQEDQLQGLHIGQRAGLSATDQLLLDGRVAQRGGVDPRAVVPHLDHHLRALLVGPHLYLARHGLSGRRPHGGQLDAVVERVTQQVDQRVAQGFQNLLVDLGVGAFQPQGNLLARLALEVAHGPGERREERLDRQHAHAAHGVFQLVGDRVQAVRVILELPLGEQGPLVDVPGQRPDLAQGVLHVGLRHRLPGALHAVHQQAQAAGALAFGGDQRVQHVADGLMLHLRDDHLAREVHERVQLLHAHADAVVAQLQARDLGAAQMLFRPRGPRRGSGRLGHGGRVGLRIRGGRRRQGAQAPLDAVQVERGQRLLRLRILRVRLQLDQHRNRVDPLEQQVADVARQLQAPLAHVAQHQLHLVRHPHDRLEAHQLGGALDRVRRAEDLLEQGGVVRVLLDGDDALRQAQQVRVDFLPELAEERGARVVHIACLR